MPLKTDIVIPRLPEGIDPPGQEGEQQIFNRGIIEAFNSLSQSLAHDLTPLHGEIYVKDSITVIELSSAAFSQITTFTNNGLSNGVTPDHTEDHLLVNKKGRYLLVVSIALQNDSTQSHTVDIDAFLNNGTEILEHVHAHRRLSGGAGDIGSISMSGIIEADVGDTVELWATSDSGTAKGVIFEDITMSMIEVKR
jgi:hypothetical protein